MPPPFDRFDPDCYGVPAGIIRQATGVDDGFEEDDSHKHGAVRRITPDDPQFWILVDLYTKGAR